MQQERHVLGSDIAKPVLHAVGMDATGKIVWRKRLSRHDRRPLVAKLPVGRIGIAACSGTPYWVRRFRAYGHAVKLRAPQCVKPYGKSNKNDRREAEAIAAAVTRPPRRVVPSKDIAQQDIPALHRGRERRMGARTALGHAVHGLMHAYGLVMPKGGAQCRPAVVGTLETAKDKLPPLSQEMLWKLVEEFAAVEEQLAYDQAKLAARATTHPAWQRLMPMPGLGPFSATARVAAVSEARACKNGRQCAAWLGLVPRQ